MEATLTQPAPASSETKPVGTGPDWVRWAFLAVVVVGLAWRAIRYFEQFPIWGDEAMLLLNILERDYTGLTQHLRFAQVAPLLFLWLEKTAILAFGTSEWSVHLFPFLAGLVGLLIFWRASHTSFNSNAAGLAVAILVVSYYPVRHSCEVKPYAFDLCFAAMYLWMTLARLRNPDQDRWLIALVATTPFAVFSSYPSVFVAGSVSLVLLPSMRNASSAQRGWFALFNLVLVGSFLVHYGLVGHHQVDAEEAAHTREFLRNYWKDAIPPDSVVQWPLWLVKVFTGNMLAYPIGAKNGGSALTFLFVLLGSVSLWRNGQRTLLALCWLPFGFNLVAAMLYKYPFGDSARITLHLAPFICILAAHGVTAALGWVRNTAWQSRLLVACHVMLLGCGVVGIVRDIRTPYKTEHDRETRRLARDISKEIAPGELVLLGGSRDEDLLAEFLWYLRADRLDLHWQSAGVDPEVRSYLLVQCGHDSLGEPVPPAGWRIAASEMRFVPPENREMPPLYCRWTRLVCE
jgi:hypothetical protein